MSLRFSNDDVSAITCITSLRYWRPLCSRNDLCGVFFQMKDVLQITPHEIKDTLIEMAYSLIEAGLIKKTKKYKGPGGGEQEEDGEKKEEGEGTEGEDKPKENGDVKDEDKNEDDLKKVR